MGQEIQYKSFSQEDRAEFNKKLTQETNLLREYFLDQSFESTSSGVCGLELEAWLLDKDFLPWPKNEKLLSQLNDSRVVPELAKFNFELNSTPQPIHSSILTQIENELAKLWQKCLYMAESIGGHAMIIGIPPILKEGMLTKEFMSAQQRYKALNEQVLFMRQNQPIKYNIHGEDSYTEVHEDIMLEAAATSLQVHLQVNLEESVRFYNALQAISAPLIALCANSPFLLGRSLWSETRIPLFEQSLNWISPHSKTQQERVGLGPSFLQESLMELFEQNLRDHSVLLPVVSEAPEETFSHLKLHNGTIWRWNRPIYSTNQQGQPQIRLEHRPLPAGPTIVDTVANIALFLGLAYFYARTEEPLEQHMTFSQVRDNFYRCAEHGLEADVHWMGQQGNVQDLILDRLIPEALNGLQQMQVHSKEAEYYLHDIIKPRALSGRNGTQWQRSFVHLKGALFQDMCKNYYDFQQMGRAVHRWTL